jgi:hypothetical protein
MAQKHPPKDAHISQPAMNDEARMRNAKAYSLLFDDGLIEEGDRMYKKAQFFVQDMEDKFAKYGEDTFVSVDQLKWLEDLAQEYL